MTATSEETPDNMRVTTGVVYDSDATHDVTAASSTSSGRIGNSSEDVHSALVWRGGTTRNLLWAPRKGRDVLDEDRRWLPSRPPAWHAILYWCVNILLAIGGGVIAGNGLHLATETSGRIFGLLPGSIAAGLGFFIVSLALLGTIGERTQIKIILLIYFVLVVQLVVVQIISLTALAIRWGAFDPLFSSYWGDYDADKRMQGQIEYDCCGYNDRDDRPAGNCTALVPSCCSGCQSMGKSCIGCKTHALRKLYAQTVPLLIGIPLFVIAQIVGLGIVGFILCRKTKMGNGMSKAQANAFKAMSKEQRLQSGIQIAQRGHGGVGGVSSSSSSGNAFGGGGGGGGGGEILGSPRSAASLALGSPRFDVG